VNKIFKNQPTANHLETKTQKQIFKKGRDNKEHMVCPQEVTQIPMPQTN